MKNKERYKKLRLVHVVTELGTGGMENGIINLCNRHDRKKFDLIICCLKSIGKMAERLQDDVKVICMNSSEGKPVFHPIKMAMILKMQLFLLVMLTVLDVEHMKFMIKKIMIVGLKLQKYYHLEL